MGKVEVDFENGGGDEENDNPPVFFLASECGEEKCEEEDVR